MGRPWHYFSGGGKPPHRHAALKWDSSFTFTPHSLCVIMTNRNHPRDGRSFEDRHTRFGTLGGAAAAKDDQSIYQLSKWPMIDPATEDPDMRSTKGFTLIELLLVLAIIGIISAIVIPALFGQRERAKQSATKDNTVSISADLASACAELSDPPSERKAGYATTAWTKDATGYKAKADEAIKQVLLMANIASTKNAYDTTPCYTASVPTVSVGNAGKVFLDPSTANIATQPVITLTGVWLDAKGVAQKTEKTVPVG